MARSGGQRGAGESFRAEHFGSAFEREANHHYDAIAFAGVRDDVQEQLSADLGGRRVAEFVERQQVLFRHLSLQPRQGALILGLNEHRRELGHPKAAHLEALSVDPQRGSSGGGTWPCRGRRRRARSHVR
jgi:hypothetical protein